MKISIVVPVYNVELYLEECLESILTQDFDDYEVICVNDGSTDRSLEILQGFAIKNRKIKIIDNPVNNGVSFSRNCGIRHAVGEYILFVDSDDMLRQGALKILSEEADRLDTDILYFDMTIKDEVLWAPENKEMLQKHSGYNRLCTGQDLFVKLCHDNQVIDEVWRQLLSRRFIEENRLYFYEGILHEDNLFSVICAMKAQKVFYLKHELYVYRRREDSITSRMNVHRMESCFIVFIELYKFWYRNTFTTEVNEAFGEYLKILYGIFEKMRCYFPDINTLTLGGPAEQLMFQIMTLDWKSHFRYAHLSKAQLNHIKDAEKVIVYGAGRVGIEMIRLLRLENIKIDAVAVSNKNINQDNLFGIEIRQIDELSELEHAVIIVAVVERNREGIVNTLKQLGVIDKAIFLE